MIRNLCQFAAGKAIDYKYFGKKDSPKTSMLCERVSGDA
jgi:hypothetical protein